MDATPENYKYVKQVIGDKMPVHSRKWGWRAGVNIYSRNRGNEIGTGKNSGV